jgi:hypothetical protein
MHSWLFNAAGESLLLSRLQKAPLEGYCQLKLSHHSTNASHQPTMPMDMLQHTRPTLHRKPAGRMPCFPFSVLIAHTTYLQVPIPTLSWADLRKAPPIDLDFAPRAFRRACCNKELQTDLVDLPNCTVDPHIARVYHRQATASRHSA